MGREEAAGPARRGVIRAPAVAGTFYPSDPAALSRTVDELLDRAMMGPHEPPPIALVAPHAGYAYSGDVAADAYARVRRLQVRRVVVLGPSHFVPLDDVAVPVATAWRTPLGAVEVDPSLRVAALDAGAVADDRPHLDEHAIEVQLPFLLRALGEGWSFLPVAVGRSPAERVADLLEGSLGLADLVVASTDLSHDLDESAARRLDNETANAILRLDPDGIGEDAACGRTALRGLVAFAVRRSLGARLLRLATSADAGGDPARVVGYGAFAFSEATA